MTQFKTREEIFQRAWEGLKSQGFVQAMKKADWGDTVCAYKTPDGLRCAIGWCMEDNALIENQAGTVYLPEVQQLAGIAPDDVDFARSLQSIHDETINPETMKQRIIGFAYANQLQDLIHWTDMQ